MNRLLLLATFATALFCSSACSSKVSKDSAASVAGPTPAEQLIERLDTLRRHGIMYAHQDDPFYGITWQWERDRSDTYELVGDYPAVLGFDLGGLEMGDRKNLDSVPFEWIREEAVRHVNRGGIITFSWHPRNPATGGNSWDVSDASVVSKVLPGGELHDIFVGWMDSCAVFLQTLTYDDGSPMPFIFRPWHEYNGSWFWWGQKLCSDEEYKAFFRMTHDFLNLRMPTNIVWSCSPNLQGDWTEETFLARWPGDSLVDVIGEDCYQWGTEADFVRQATADVVFLSRYARERGKIFAITECGFQNSPVADWWTRVFMPVVEQGDEVSFFLPWRNWHADHFGASKDAKTAADFKRLYEAPNTLFLRDIAQ